ncbi:MAG: hypothetical protein EOP38_05850 [Rubrivivax sp.]|nr:MAG: hypothetical protein EOP38_05850 [Rubrivivax sp.]
MQSFKLTTGLALALAFCAGVHMTMGATQVQTTEPLLLLAGHRHGGAQPYALLPAGTLMFRDASLPGGHTRYLVYVDVQGDFAQRQVDASQADLRESMLARPLGPHEQGWAFTPAAPAMHSPPQRVPPPR